MRVAKTQAEAYGFRTKACLYFCSVGKRLATDKSDKKATKAIRSYENGLCTIKAMLDC
jgi:hypothetical protein